MISSSNAAIGPPKKIFLKPDKFPKGAPYHGRTVFCSKGHDIKQYQKYNPHQKGVIPDKRAGANGAAEKFRHRLTDSMCVKCHPMRDLIEYPELRLLYKVP
jgi:hypothetical protein